MLGLWNSFNERGFGLSLIKFFEEGMKHPNQMP